MEQLLNQLAEARGLPASLVERSAQARAQATGQSTEDVLREWAEEEGIATGAAEPSSPPAEAAEAEAPPAPEAPAETPAPAEVAPVAVEGGLSGAELLDAVAAARGMPAPLVERSAEARAKKTGATTDAVLQEWAVEAGIDVGGVPAAAPEAEDAPVSAEAPPPAEAPPAEPPSTPAAPVAAAGGLSGAALLDAVAEARGMPASLVERSAGARAKKTGATTDAVLREWAAEAGIDVGAAPVAEAPAEAPAPAVEAAPAEAVVEPEPADKGPRVEVVEPVTEAAAAPVTDPEDDGRRRRYPVWLAAALVIIPLVAVLYLVVVPNGPRCGSAGQLSVDPETGQAVGCDGAAYGVGEMNAFAAGEAIYQANCAVCHAADGSGGAGPAMSGGAVLVAFPENACADHIKWVALGSTEWPESTYGATAKPVAGGMPGFETSLLEEEIAQVVLYERVAFGGEEIEAAEAACGLGEDGEDGEAVTASG